MSRQLDRPLEWSQRIWAYRSIPCVVVSRLTCVNPKQVFDRLRIEQACGLLRDTNLSMDRIAQLCGFSGNTPFGVL